MTRKVLICGARCEVSKNEAKEANRLYVLCALASRSKVEPVEAQRAFDTWLLATTPEAKARRIAVGRALGLKVPE